MIDPVKKLLVVAICAAGAVSLAGQAPSQEPAPQQPTFRTGIDVIAVDVGVVDSRGRPVEDLRSPDFAVRIDGQPRRVVSAELVQIDVEAARKQAVDPFETLYTTNLTPPNGRMIMIAVDQLNIRTGAARPLLSSAVKFLDMLSPADRVAFAAYPSPGVAVDFTNDHLRLKLAMERVVGNQNRFLGNLNIGLYEAIAIVDKHDERIFQMVLGRECRGLRGPALEGCERDVLTETSLMVRNIRQDTAESLRGLYGLLRQLSLIEGPKTLILLSEGIVLDSPNELDDVIAAAAVARVSINVLMMDVPRDDITLSQQRPTISEDRDMQVQGLRNLAIGSRGALYQVLGSGENIFERLSSELSAYYLLGVEQSPTDRDGGRHRIDVEVLRRGLTVRSRRAFVLSAATSGAKKPEETLNEALRAPFGVAEVPLRVTTFTRQDTATGKVRVMLAAEVGQPGAPSQEYTVGYVLLDSDGRQVSGAGEKRMLSAPNGIANAPLDYLRDIVVEPGVYSLRFGVVDSTGRRGGVVREVNAWKLEGEEFALGDLLVGEVSGNTVVRPGVEPRVRGRLGALIELYSTSPTSFDNAVVLFEIANDQDSPALVTETATLYPGPSPTWRVAQGVMVPALLPPGRYMARARVLRDDKVAGVLVRPFVLEAPAVEAGAPAPAAPGIMFSGVPGFAPESVLARDTLAAMLDAVEKSAPSLKDAMVEARAGRYGIAAVEALTAGEQAAAAFFKGLDWYSKGELDDAATQLAIAAGPRREFFPAAFYLGASYAAGGRDRDAAAVWQMAIGSQARPQLAYVLFADARMRDNQPASVIDVLQPAHQRTPADDEIGRRLAMAYLMLGRHAEAIPVLDGYLTRHATDNEALFAAVFAQYQHTNSTKVTPSTADLTKLARYVRAYRGPQQELLQKYLEVLRTQ